jgi:hypothetical protein
MQIEKISQPRTAIDRAARRAHDFDTQIVQLEVRCLWLFGLGGNAGNRPTLLSLSEHSRNHLGVIVQLAARREKWSFCKKAAHRAGRATQRRYLI